MQAALERGLEVELTDHVGYERGDPDASLCANSRNGTTPKMVSSEIGEVDLAVPRDRNGTFTPQLIPKGSRRLGGLDEMIISLYAGGTTLRDIQHHLVSTIGVSDMIIIHTRDATLVCAKDEAQRVKELVGRVKEKYPGKFL